MNDWEKDLEIFAGAKVARVVGYVSAEFGADTLTFHISAIELENGKRLWVEGEHDNAYICGEGLDEAALQAHRDE